MDGTTNQACEVDPGRDQASILIHPLIQAMSFGQTVMEMARGQYWIHPALSEIVETALLGLELDAKSDGN